MICLLLLLQAVLGSCSQCHDIRKTRVSQDQARGLSKMTVVIEIDSEVMCVELCMREAPRCIAAHLDISSCLCNLYDGHRHFEGPEATSRGNQVKLWLLDDSGRCPSSFSSAWRNSRYLLLETRANWETALALCKERGGKLAEVSSEAELQYLANEFDSSGGRYNSRIRLGGFQEPGAKTLKDGWRWYTSGHAVNMSSAFWRDGEPNSFDETTIAIFRKRFNDIGLSHIYENILCECIQL